MFTDGSKSNVLAVDIYALGIILWQLWFKQTPFASVNHHVLISMVTRDQRPPLPTAPDSASPEPPPALVKVMTS